MEYPGRIDDCFGSNSRNISCHNFKSTHLSIPFGMNSICFLYYYKRSSFVLQPLLRKNHKKLCLILSYAQDFVIVHFDII